MRGIDVSHWNGWPYDDSTAAAYVDADFVVVKATQGISYGHTDYFRKTIDKALRDGKLIGAYHYATGKLAEAEADYFISIVKPYIGKIVLALDWEDGQNKAYDTPGADAWVKAFVDRVREKTGLTCFIYTGMGGQEQCKSVANICPLWFAGYPKDRDSWEIPKWPSYYYTDPWKNYTIWQFTSGGCDRNVTNLTPAQWKKWATPVAKEPAKMVYSGAFPSLPSRGYYTIGDGYKQLPGMVQDIKKLQALVNWINDGEIRVDGAYGPNTAAAVKLAQTGLKVTVDGLFGSKTLMAAKRYSK